MSVHTYVARKYDVEFELVYLPYEEFNSMFDALVELSQDETNDLAAISYCSDDYGTWYEIEKKPLEEMLAYLKTLDKANDVFLDNNQKPVCPAVYVNRLETLLAPVGKDMDFVRVEFD